MRETALDLSELMRLAEIRPAKMVCRPGNGGGFLKTHPGLPNGDAMPEHIGLTPTD